MSHAEKQTSAAPDISSDKRQNIAISLADEGAEVRPSPARSLQQRLQAHYVPYSHQFMTRFVTLFVGFAMLGTWLAQNGTQTIV